MPHLLVISTRKADFMKRILSFVLIFFVVFSATSCSSSKKADTIVATVNSNSTDTSKEDLASKPSGQFIGTALGMGGEVKVTIIVENGIVTACTALGVDETPSIGGEAIYDLPSVILKNKSVDVDSISGATITSDAVISAATNALISAGLDPHNFQ